MAVLPHSPAAAIDYHGVSHDPRMPCRSAKYAHASVGPNPPKMLVHQTDDLVAQASP